MADEKQTIETQVTETQPQSTETTETTETKTEHTIPSYRLKEEADKRRAAEAKVAEFEKADKERNEADLSAQEKLTKLQGDFDAYKGQVAKATLQTSFTQKLIEANLDPKIAKVAAKAVNDLSEDNIDGKVKEAVKEFADFIKTEDKTNKSGSSFLGVQPKSGDSKPRPKGGTPTMDAVMTEFMNEIDKKK